MWWRSRLTRLCTVRLLQSINGNAASTASHVVPVSYLYSNTVETTSYYLSSALAFHKTADAILHIIQDGGEVCAALVQRRLTLERRHVRRS
jgi:hypothetical protein